MIDLFRRALLGSSLGGQWPDAKPTGYDQHPFRGSSASLENEAYWVFRYMGLKEGVWDVGYFYQMGGSPVPTLERHRWVLPLPEDAPRAPWRAFRRALVESFMNVTSGVTWEHPDSTAILHLGHSRVRVRLTTDFEETRLIDFRVDRISASLADLEDDLDPWGNDPTTDQDLHAGIRARSLALAVRAIDPLLARAIETTVADSSWNEAARDSTWIAVWRSLRLSRDPRMDHAQRDLLWYASHTIVDRLAWSIAYGDTVRVNAINAELQPYGAKLVMTYDGVWCNNGALAESLASMPARSFWAEEAFLERSGEGWGARCSLCGHQPPYGPDRWRAVIEHGEPFLRAHPESHIAPELTLMLAQAHETAWSLSRADSADDYINASRYVLDAPSHRLRAMELYEKHLESRLSDPRNEAIRKRLLRMKIDVDTSYHPFWCLWD